MQKFLISLTIVTVLVYLAFGALLFSYQRDFLYSPAPAIAHKYTEIDVSNEGETLKMVALNSGKPSAILYFGGNSESVEYNIDDFLQAFPDVSIYLPKYRGYGGSTGKPTEVGLYSDALFIYDQLKAKHENIAVIGRSLGSGVATFVASKRAVEKLVLITPFDSIQNIAQASYPIFPMSLLLKDKHDSIGRVASIKAKTLLLVAEHDALITRDMSERLFKQFPAAQARQVIIKKTGHNTISSGDGYYDLMSEFLVERAGE
ncbi:MAG TPA: alpha/beta hydrolase [Leucothrix mucor]|nr:alpha/beta hydrolase [Leucothrix mucor]